VSLIQEQGDVQNFDFWAFLPYIGVMRKMTYILSAAFLSLSLGTAAIACEYHNGGVGAPYQSRWSNIVPDQSTPDEDSSYEDSVPAEKTPAAKKKPVFSKAATRASDVAKARVVRKSKAEKDVAKTQIVLEQASR